MIWGQFSFYGAGKLHICESNMNKEQYLDVLKNRLLPQMEEWRANDVCTFMQDNAPCHTAKIIKKFFEDQHINVLDWPGNSPDLNPIENLWAIVKSKLKNHNITTKKELISLIIQIWTRDVNIPNILQNLVTSMPRRMQQVVKEKGGITKF